MLFIVSKFYFIGIILLLVYLFILFLILNKRKNEPLSIPFKPNFKPQSPISIPSLI